MDALSLEQQLPYAFFTQAGSQQPPPPQPQPPPPPPPASQQQPPPPPPQVPVGLPQGGSLMPSASLTRGPQLPPLAVTVPSSLPQSPPENSGQPPMGIDTASVSPGRGLMGGGGGGACAGGAQGLWETPIRPAGGVSGCLALSAATLRLHFEANLARGWGCGKHCLGLGAQWGILPGILKPSLSPRYRWGN